MYYVARDIHFSYGHRLMEHPGPCGHLHGHNGRVQVEVSSQMLNQQNMVMDFAEIRATIGNWIKENLDHKMILWNKDPLAKVLKDAGEPVVVMKENPTAEAIVHWVYEQARHLRLPVAKVTLWETHDSCASYHE